MSDSGLQVRPLSPPNVADAGGHTYAFTIRDITLGFLYTEPDSFAFTWDGLIEFDHLMGKIYGLLFTLLGSFSFDSIVKSASFIMRSNELITLDDTTHTAQNAQLASILEAPDEIAYARFDFDILLGSVASWLDKKQWGTLAFGADNPRDLKLGQGPPSMSLQAPAQVEWPNRLFNWVVEHHVAGRELLSDGLDIESVEEWVRVLMSRESREGDQGHWVADHRR